MYSAQLGGQLAEIVSHLPHDSQPALLPTLEESPEGADTTSIMTATSARLKFYKRAFDSTLFDSRPYRGLANTSMISLTSSQRRGIRWSLFSGRSNTSVLSLPYSGTNLSEISDISSVTIPIAMDGLYHPQWYAGVGKKISSQPVTFRNRVISLAALAARGPNPRFALRHAIEIGDIETVLQMLTHGPNIILWSSRYKSLLLLVVDAGYAKIAEMLLDRGVDVQELDSRRRTPLHLAAKSGHQALVKLLLDRGGDIEGLDLYENTALHLAAKFGHKSVVSLMLDRGAEIEAGPNSEYGPLHYSAASGHDGVAKVLLDRGANVRAQGRGNITPLHFSAKGGHEVIARLLVSRGAETDCYDLYSTTPLHNGARNGCGAVVSFLDCRANIETKGHGLCNPLFCSVK